MTTILENALIEKLAAGLPRTERHIGGLQESDAELVRMPGSDTVLAVTTDTIVEEIELGLYDDPYLIGWMAVIASASDLAAVGAAPLGILINEVLPVSMSDADLFRLQDGIRDACTAGGLPVLGGDTNTARCLQVGATAIGLVTGERIITRRGSRAGEALLASGPLGLGSVFALAQLEPDAIAHSFHIPYKPAPRLREGQLVRSLATACMDTSDGALATLDQLMRLNDVGFVVYEQAAMHPAAGRLATQLGIPPWMLLAGLHGEFELIFTVPVNRVEELHRRAELLRWEPIEIGRVVGRPGVWIQNCAGRSELDTGRIRNLFAEPIRDVQACIDRLETMEEPCTL